MSFIRSNKIQGFLNNLFSLKQMAKSLKSKLGVAVAGLGLIAMAGTAQAGKKAEVYDKGFDFLINLAHIQGDTTITQGDIPNMDGTFLPFGDLEYATRNGEIVTVVSKTEDGTYEKVSPYKIGWGPFSINPGKLVCPQEVRATQYNWVINQQATIHGEIIDRKSYTDLFIDDLPEFVNGTTFVIDSSTQIKLKPRKFAGALAEIFTEVPDSLIPTSFGFFEACGKKYGFLYLGREYGQGIDYIWDLSEKDPPTTTKYPKNFPWIANLGNVFRPDKEGYKSAFIVEEGKYVLRFKQPLF